MGILSSKAHGKGGLYYLEDDFLVPFLFSDPHLAQDKRIVERQFAKRIVAP